jgi:LAO/AO transport system kinase
VQAAKAGVLEVADVLVVNKGDRPGAARAAGQLRAMMSSAGGRVARQPAPILITSAASAEGVPALADAIEQHRSVARSPEQARARAGSQVARALADLAGRRASQHASWGTVIEAVAEREMDPLTAAERLLEER